MNTGWRILLPMMVLALAHCLPARAHEVRPAYLEMRETATGIFSILWKVPARGQDLRLGLHVRLPGDCVESVGPVGYFSNNAHTQRWQVTCAQVLDGRVIGIDGLSSTLTDVLVRIERGDGSIQSGRVLPSRPYFTVEAVPGPWQVMGTYFALGIEHILLGFDHLLFVLALLLIVQGTWRLVATITAFTIAHSLTLASATLGLVSIPIAPVEACIALSIVFVAAEIVHQKRGVTGLTSRRPWIVAFLFGLLHGLGFASALGAAGLPQGAIPAALLFFNLGVEAGQLVFIALVLGLLAGRQALTARFPGYGWVATLTPARAAVACAYVMGPVAAYWVVERTLGIWS